MRIPTKWQSILSACAQAYKQNKQLIPRQWLRENHPELKWRTAERFLSVPKLVAYLAGDLTEQSPALCDEKQPAPLSPKQFKQKCGRVGAPYGNRNAIKHGIYSKFLTDEEEQIRQEVYGIEHVKQELALARVLLARTLRKQTEIEQVSIHDFSEGKPSICAMRIAEYELRSDLSGGRGEREKWVLPDTDAIIDRLLARIAQLTMIGVQQAQMPVLTQIEQLAFIQSFIIGLNNGKLTAVEAGLKLESQLIPLPGTLTMMIRAELAMGNDAEIEGDRVTGEQIKARAEQLRTEKTAKKEAFLIVRREELRSLDT